MCVFELKIFLFILIITVLRNILENSFNSWRMLSFLHFCVLDIENYYWGYVCFLKSNLGIWSNYQNMIFAIF